MSCALGDQGRVFGILEPRDPSREAGKARRQARRAVRTRPAYSREKRPGWPRTLLPPGHEHKNTIAIRNKVRGIMSDAELDKIFEDDAKAKD